MMRRRHAAGDPRDRGAAAVEFALLLPVLLLLLFGIIDFGRLINAQITLTQAAREGVRLAALGQSSATVQTRVTAAAGVLSPVTATVTTACTTAGAATDAVVTVTYTFTFITPVGAFAAMFGTANFGSIPKTLTATGEMVCET